MCACAWPLRRCREWWLVATYATRSAGGTSLGVREARAHVLACDGAHLHIITFVVLFKLLAQEAARTLWGGAQGMHRAELHFHVDGSFQCVDKDLLYCGRCVRGFVLAPPATRVLCTRGQAAQRSVPARQAGRTYNSFLGPSDNQFPLL